jgi:hypothetical protein
MSNRYSKPEFDQKFERLLSKASSMTDVQNAAYDLIKKDKISPAQMTEIVIAGYKKFLY